MPEIHGRSVFTITKVGFAKSAENSGETSGGRERRKIETCEHAKRSGALARVCAWKIKRVREGAVWALAHENGPIPKFLHSEHVTPTCHTCLGL